MTTEEKEEEGEGKHTKEGGAWGLFERERERERERESTVHCE